MLRKASTVTDVGKLWVKNCTFLLNTPSSQTHWQENNRAIKYHMCEETHFLLILVPNLPFLANITSLAICAICYLCVCWRRTTSQSAEGAITLQPSSHSTRGVTTGPPSSTGTVVPHPHSQTPGILLRHLHFAAADNILAPSVHTHLSMTYAQCFLSLEIINKPSISVKIC